ncbi:TonB-dependent receptor [Sideroxydans sp. CL21]|jgi:outer membrane receptor protein involved in Fe transport|uniref:TonB-dependent receptor n=1 Tax=Sideroxydans sp. CL21 TaxID=2600596 RepID=UPI0012A92778|nr:TonB-dependent receptor [Sideroxydans sp. CL21]VVC85711.1 Zinc-regulated outer membrane receptor [Sideroxydans sp. CL21]
MLKRTLLCAALSAPLCAYAANEQGPSSTAGQAEQTTEISKLNAIKGQLRNAVGQPIAGANITLKSATGEVIGNTTSNAEGDFSFSSIAPGSYVVLSDKAGYEYNSSNVTLQAGVVNTTITLAASQAPEINITVARLNEARNGLSPKTGGSVYRFEEKDIDTLPQGDSTPLNQVLLQAPGVVNDSYGQLHVRGDHGNMQYRINGVILPEGISGFGQALDTRFAQNINLLTGALPAQYGYRTAGVVEIDTKTKFDNGGRVDMYGGSFNTFNPSVEYGGTKDNLSYFVSGSYLTDNVGIENPTASRNPIHDTTQQSKEFGFLSYLLNPDTKLSLMFGSYDGKFQIPNNPGQTPDPNNLGILGQLPAGYTPNSGTLNDQQREVNRFVVSSVQSSLNDNIDYQVSLFTRYSSTHYMPDIFGNLAFNGVASDAFRSSSSTGIQADASNRLNETHTLRMGLFGSDENIQSNNTAMVFPVNASTGLVSGAPYNIVDNNPKNGNTLVGVYLQDEWKATGKLTINYGARFDQVNAFVNEHQLSPRLGMVYKFSDQTTLHAGYSRYFTPPPTELVSTSTQALFQNTTNAAPGLNSSVKSERSNYYDAGVMHQLTSTTSLGLDSFYKQTRNTIDEGQFGPALILTPYNYAQGRIYGVELTGNYKSDNLTGYTNLARTVSQAKDIISSQYLFNQATLDYAANNWVNVDHEQALTFSTGGSYLLSGTRLSSDVIFQSGLRNGFANTTNLPSYTVVNLGASRKINLDATGPVEIRLVINNLFDKVYEIRDGSGIGVFAPQYGPRLGLFLGLTKQL